MANTTIALRQSGATGNTPSLGVLANGELSINYADSILYFKTASNTLGSIRTTQPAGLTTEVQFNDAGSFGSTSQVTINKASGEFRATTIKSTQSSGDEGGQIDLATAATNSTLAGGYVNIDIYQNRLRIFEAGGTNRGVYIDIANSAAVGVGTDLLGSTTIGQEAFNKANTANITAEAAYSKANASNVIAQAAFNQANNSLANTGTSVTANSLTQYTFANTTSSTSKTTGALVVAGGVGVSGDLYAGNSLVVDNGTYGNVTITQFASVWGQAYGANPYSIMQVRSSDFYTGIGITAYATNGPTLYSSNNITFRVGTNVRDKDFPTGGTYAGQFAANGAFIAQASLASTSNATGSIQVVGGVGVKGNVAADGIIFPDNTRQTTAATAGASIGDVLALSIALG